MNDPIPLSDENKLIAQRREKLDVLRQKGQAFPNDFKRKHLAGSLHEAHGEASDESLEESPIQVSLAGRMMGKRIMGKASFTHLQDMSGRIQIFVQRDQLPEGVYDAFKSWDVGDIIGVTGALFRTKAGELSVRAESIRLLTKSLRPLPEKYHGLSDAETRYRQRYVDLIVTEESRNVFRVRSAVIQHIRQFLAKRDFIEVETPMMQVIPGGARAKPFVTHHNALDMPLYLRIAPELYLKRLVVGGFERVFEINRSFRNEGLSTRHNPEFTMLEFYQAYADYHELMDTTEHMLRQLALEIMGSHSVSHQGETIDLSRPFQRWTMREAVLHHHPQLNPDAFDHLENARRACLELSITPSNDWGLGRIITELFESFVEEKLLQPTFITEFPTEVSPLARRSDHNPEVTDRFELFIGGREIANGFSELNDAEDQAERFRAQVAEKDAGDEEAMHYDADYIRALEYGMPPTAGEGIGIDRLVMFLTDSPSIRDVILFPHMRRESQTV